MRSAGINTFVAALDGALEPSDIARRQRQPESIRGLTQRQWGRLSVHGRSLFGRSFFSPETGGECVRKAFRPLPGHAEPEVGGTLPARSWTATGETSNGSDGTRTRGLRRDRPAL